MAGSADTGCHCSPAPKIRKTAGAPELTFAIVGNPNCGKTTVFNALTGGHQHTGNWAGVTVEKKVGRFAHGGRQVELVDLPGVYSLTVAGGNSSLDERLARDYIVSAKPDLLIDLIDASNLERNLYLTVQLLEMGTPMMVALNMMDVARARSIEIDMARLSHHLGCPVVPLVAATGKGLDRLRDVAVAEAERGAPPDCDVEFGPEIETAIADLTPMIARSTEDASPRWLAIKHLEGDELCPGMTDPALAAPVAARRAALETELAADVDTAVACGRYDLVTRIARGSMQRTNELGRTFSDRLDRIVLGRALGFPLFLLAVYLMFMFTINIGGAFIDFFDILGRTLFVDTPAAILSAIGAPDWLITILATGIGSGIQTVATFVPIVGFLFIALSVLEESGYMARAAFVTDRLMRRIGLPGKSFVPLIVGFGCNVPAIMAARTLERRRDRTITVLMTPFMSCGARMPVYALFAAAFFPTGGQNLVFLLYLIGLAAAVGTGFLLKTTLLRGETDPFVMELPPYHLPTLRGLLRRTWERLRAFVMDAGKIIVMMVAALAFLNSWGTDGSFGHEDSESSVLSGIGRAVTPIFAPMGISQENWPATVGILSGLLAKEAVVGTMNTLYSGLSAGAPDPEPFSFAGGIREAFSTLGPNLRGALGQARDPMGIGVGELADQQVAAAEQEVDQGTFGRLVTLFDGRIGAFAYLLMVLLYMPCVATLGAIWRETGRGWTLFAGGWTLGLGYGSAVLFYQAATFARHPGSSALWIAGILACLAGFVWVLRRIGARTHPGRMPVAMAE
ncbi:Fe(2+) transporter permease subunit FeoB [Tropicimonas sp.]|uniref:Fe(2+) transporter permease subunit FeoB n=1 Tax=Tropicimonas sp. TaxID=2067044 RepID=UPI003A83C392